MAFISAIDYAQNNSYCKPFPFSRSQCFKRCDILAVIREHGRYYGINFDELNKHRTIEFRYHHGTLDAEKVINWLILCLCFVEHGHKLRADKILRVLKTSRKQRTLNQRAVYLCKTIKVPTTVTRYLLKRANDLQVTGV